MIRGMATAGRLLGREDWIDSAERPRSSYSTRLWRDGLLLASWRADQARLPAYLDDYAFLLAGLLELLRARWEATLV